MIAAELIAQPRHVAEVRLAEPDVERRIGRELGINRRTVRRYVEEEAKCTSISTPGSGEPAEAKCTTISTPGAESVAGKQPAVSVAEPWGRRSRCEPFEAAIDAKMKAGLSAQRIYQDLVGENGFRGSYQSVKRFVRRLKARQPERVWRMECQLGEEMQVDFCLGAPIEGEDGKRRRSWVLRAVLSYSRTETRKIREMEHQQKRYKEISAR